MSFSNTGIKERLRKLVLEPRVNRAMRFFLGPLHSRQSLPRWFWARQPVVGTIEVPFSPGVAFRYHSHGEYLGKVLYWRGVFNFERGSTSLLSSLARSSRSFFDIGAYSGLYSLLAKSANPSIEVYAFEPLPHLYRWVKLNASLNGLADCMTIEQVAIAERSEENVPFFVPEEEWPSTSTLAETEESQRHQQAILVNTYSLDEYVEMRGVQHADLIKIDVEGAEASVLEGARQTLRRHRPFVVCEILPRDARALPRVESVMKEADYRYSQITPRGIIAQKDLVPDKNCRNFLLWPVEKEGFVSKLVATNNETSGSIPESAAASV